MGVYGRGGTWILISIGDWMSHFLLDSLIDLCLFNSLCSEEACLLLKSLRGSLAKSLIFFKNCK